MKTFTEFQEALIAKVSKNKKNSGIDPRILEKFPNRDPLKPGDYKWLKKQSIPLDTAMKTEEAIAAPTNSTGTPVPGTGDDSSTVVVNKKKRYIYGGTGSRKMWMNNK